jgi:hypothetical protein
VHPMANRMSFDSLESSSASGTSPICAVPCSRSGSASDGTSDGSVVASEPVLGGKPP